METLRKFMEALQTDPRAEELLKGKAKPESQEDAVRIYAEAAKELGFSLTEDDIRKGIKALQEEQAAKTEQAKEAVRKLELDDLEKVAGGANSANAKCGNTYEDRENCWFSDGCDNLIIVYSYYICNHRFWDGSDD